MASWGAVSWPGSGSRTADTPWRFGTIRSDRTEKLNAITKYLLHLARQLTHYTAEYQKLLAPPEVVTISLDCCAFGSAIKRTLKDVFYGLNSDVDASPSADVQADVTCICTNGNDDMDRLGMFCVPISPHALRVS